MASWPLDLQFYAIAASAFEAQLNPHRFGNREPRGVLVGVRFKSNRHNPSSVSGGPGYNRTADLTLLAPAPPSLLSAVALLAANELIERLHQRHLCCPQLSNSVLVGRYNGAEFFDPRRELLKRNA